MMNESLPSKFQELAPYVKEWALATENARHKKRSSCTPEELRDFYDTMLPHIEGILDYLDTFPLGQLPQAEQNLLNLALSMAHAGLFIEVYRGKTYVPHAFAEDRFITDAETIKTIRPTLD